MQILKVISTDFCPIDTLQHGLYFIILYLARELQMHEIPYLSLRLDWINTVHHKNLQLGSRIIRNRD